MNSYQTVTLLPSWWKWPVDKETFLPQATFQLLDHALDRITFFCESYATVRDVRLESMTHYRKVEDVVFRFLSINLFDEQRIQVGGSGEITTPCSLFLQFSHQNKPCQLIVLTEKLLCSDKPNLFFGFDLMRGSIVVLKKIGPDREKKGVDLLLSQKEELSRNHIHSIIACVDEVDEIGGKDFYLVQDYCPRGDLFRLIEQKGLPMWHRLSLCRDVVTAVYFLHQLEVWEYEDKNKVRRFVEKTAHLDLKPENFVVEKVRGVEKAFVIDYEMMGSFSNSGTLHYFDPQKMQLRRLLRSWESRDFEAMNKIKTWAVPFFEEFKDRKTRSSQLNLKIHQFQQDYGQGHDIWALGLVLLILITNKISVVTRFSSVSYWETILDQQSVNDRLNSLKNDLFVENRRCFFSRWTKEIRAIFQLIQGALTIDYDKRIDIRELKSGIDRIGDCKNF